MSSRLIRRFVSRPAHGSGFTASLLFFPAHNSLWAQAWAFLAIFAAGSFAFGAWLVRRDPALLALRLGPLVQRGQPFWDKIFC
jgi:hypothetical protein